MQTPAIPPEVKTAIGRGDKIAAVKLLRSATELGLKEAKDAVEQIESGGPLFAAQPMAGTTVSEEVARALRQGNKLQAIRLYRQQEGVGLKEAKEAIEAMPERQQPASDGLSPGEVKKSPVFLWIAVAIVAGVAAALLYF